jgi:REP element-mobilizing transposase RayT
MPWRRRHHLPDAVFEDNHHVVSLTTCTAGRGRWLGDVELAGIVRDEVLRIHDGQPVLGYCLMPDHLHLIVCNAGVPVSRTMNLLKGRASKRVRALRPGLDVWMPGYWDHIVRKHEGLYAVLRYVLSNPVRAGLAERWWDYPWLGSPMLGPVGPDFFGSAAPEDIVWSEILRI